MICTNKLYDYTITIFKIDASDSSAIRSAATEFDSIIENTRLEFINDLKNTFRIETKLNNEHISISEFIDDIDSICSVVEYSNLIYSIKTSIHDYLEELLSYMDPVLTDGEVMECLNSISVILNLYPLLPEEKKEMFSPDDKNLLIELSTRLQLHIPNSYESLVNQLLDNQINYNTYKRKVSTLILPLIMRDIHSIIEGINPSMDNSIGSGTGISGKMSVKQFEESISSNSFATDSTSEQRILEQQNVNKMLQKANQGAFERQGINKDMFKKKK